MPTDSASERRMGVREAVLWESVQAQLTQLADSGPVDVLDIGGGTGGLAVRIAELDHRVTVVDPSPDALAALSRRAAEAGVEVDAQQGDLAGLGDLVGASSADLVLCHGVLEVVEDPDAALATIVDVLRPGGVLSLVVNGRHAAVIARAMGGHLTAAMEALAATDTDDRSGRRYSAAEVEALVSVAGLVHVSTQGIRVFADLVPGALLDLEPGATAALLDLERAVTDREEYLPLATRLHVLARHN